MNLHRARAALRCDHTTTATPNTMEDDMKTKTNVKAGGNRLIWVGEAVDEPALSS